jgi:hypothetical protein
MNQALWALVGVIIFLLGYIVFLHFSRERELKTIIAGMLSQNPYEFSTAIGSRANPLKKAVIQAAQDAGQLDRPGHPMQKAL